MSAPNEEQKFETVCPHCGRQYVNVPIKAAGRNLTCKKCARSFEVVLRPSASSGREKTDRKRPRKVHAEPAPTEPDPEDRVDSGAETILLADNESTILKDSGGAAQWARGDVILDLYQVIDLLGQGGMGRVYRVHHRGWGVDLAVKMPTPETLAAIGGVESFEREAETWVNLGLHPHTVSCYYVRRVKEIPCVFAEYVSGGSLHDWIIGPEGGPGPLYEGGPADVLARIMDYAIQFAYGLNYAHVQGLVHQDVKPANVMVASGDRVKVTDFGLARARPGFDPASRDMSLKTDSDRPGVPAGTPAYYSPEQAAGSGLTLRSDLWSWALSLVEMFMGGRSWESGTVAGEVLEEYLETGPDGDRLPEMPRELARFLKRCFNLEPGDRPEGMAEAAGRLAEIYLEITGKKYPRRLPRAGRATADSQNNRAVSLVDLDRTAEAEKLWTAALKTHPNHPESTYNRGLMLWRSARMDDEYLIKSLAESSRSHPENWICHYLAGLVHLERDDHLTALKALSNMPAPDSTRQEVGAARIEAKNRLKGSKRLLVEYPGHQGNINDLCLNLKGNRLVSAGDDGEIIIWNLFKGQPVRTITGHGGPVKCIALSLDSRYILSGGGDFTSPDFSLKLWRTATGQSVKVLGGHLKAVNAVCLDRMGGRAASGSDDRTVKIWHLAAGELLQTFKGHRGPVNAVVFSPDGALVVSAGTDRNIMVWDMISGSLRRTLTGHEGRVLGLSRITDDNLFLSCGADKSVRLWSLEYEKPQKVFKGHRGEVNAVCLSRDGGIGVSAGGDKKIKFWDVKSGRCLRTYAGHRSFVLAAAMSHSGGLIITGGMDSKIKVWRGRGKSVNYAAPFVLSRIFSSEAAVLSGSEYERCLEAAARDLEMGRVVRAAQWIRRARSQPGYARGGEALDMWSRLYLHLPHGGFKDAWEKATLTGHNQEIEAVVLSRDGQLALSGAMDHAVRVWDVTSGQEKTVFTGHEAPVKSVDLSREGKTAVSADSEGVILIWDAGEPGRDPQRLKGHANGVNAVVFHPNGLKVVSGGEDRKIRVWDIKTGGCEMELEGHRSAVNSVAISPDGGRILSGGGDHLGEDCVVKLWDARTGKTLASWDGHQRAVNTVCYSPDGRLGLSGSSDSTIRMWNPVKGEELGVLGEHDGPVNSVAITGDGRYALSGGGDRRLKLWDIRAGRSLRTFEGHNAPVAAVGFSLNGRLAVSGGAGHEVKLWTLNWDLTDPPESGWDKNCLPWLKAGAALLAERKGPAPLEKADLDDLFFILGCAGYGWLDRKKVEEAVKQLKK